MHNSYLAISIERMRLMSAFYSKETRNNTFDIKSFCIPIPFVIQSFIVFFIF